jgi:hypothetical protein
MHQGKAVPIRGSVLENVGEYFEGADDGVNYVLDLSIARLKKFIEKDLPGKFTKGELMLMVDVMNGTMLTAGMAGRQLAGNVADGIALDHLDRKWDIDAAVLTQKFESMSIIDLAYLEIWIKAFWDVAHKKEIYLEDYIKPVQAAE